MAALMQQPRPSRSPWRGLVLVASLLACGACQASGQISVTSSPAIEGFAASLDLQGVPEGAQEYSWHRGERDGAASMLVSYRPPSGAWRPGPLHSGRENVTAGGRLVIRDSRLNDTGSYTVRVDLGREAQRATGWLEVQEWEDAPGISANATSAVELGEPVAAFCRTNATDPARIRWYVNSADASGNERAAISPDGKTLLLLQPRRFDVTIHCAVTNAVGFPQRSDSLHLTVAYGPDSMMLKTRPSMFGGVLPAEVGSAVRLECSSASSPRPAYRWVHNGSVLSTGASLSLPSLTWGQMGRYRCIVENPAARLRLYRDVRIQRPRTIPVGGPEFSLSGSLAVFFIGMIVLGGVYLCGVLIYFLVTRLSTRRSRAI